MEKKTLGRKKVEMVKMTNESHLQVTFSKRRTGLFKKASEFSIICGAEVGLVVISPGKKVFSFGNPSVLTVIDRFLGSETRDNPEIEQLLEARRNANIKELCTQITQVTSLLRSEKKRGEELNKVKKANQQQNWWMSPVEELNLSQLLQLKPAMEELKKNVEAEMMFSVLNPNPRQFYTVPDMIVPSPGYNPYPAHGYSVFPSEGYTVSVNPIVECNANPCEVYNNNSGKGETVTPADGDDANAQGADVFDPLDFFVDDLEMNFSS